MAHYKRKGPKSTRAGCLLCKPYKRQGSKLVERAPFNQVRKEKDAADQIAEARNGSGASIGVRTK